MTNLDFLSTEQAGFELGFHRNAHARACRENPGFGVRLNGSYRIPRDHIERVKAGDTPAQIAAEVRARVGRKAG